MAVGWWLCHGAGAPACPEDSVSERLEVQLFTSRRPACASSLVFLMSWRRDGAGAALGRAGTIKTRCIIYRLI